MPGVQVDGDTAFPLLLREVVAPAGIAGLVGLVAAGLIGAILSSVDSMMNSAATLITFDFYKRYVNPEATDKQLIRMGRVLIGVMVIGCALLTIVVFDPNTKQLFFTYVASHQSKLVGGVVVAFAVGMLWKGATAAGGFASIITGVVVSYAVVPVYEVTLGKTEFFSGMFGANLNFFHGVFVAAIFATLANVIVSKMTQADEQKSSLTLRRVGRVYQGQSASLDHQNCDAVPVGLCAAWLFYVARNCLALGCSVDRVSLDLVDVHRYSAQGQGGQPPQRRQILEWPARGLCRLHAVLFQVNQAAWPSAMRTGLSSGPSRWR